MTTPADRLSEVERLRMLGVLDQIRETLPLRPSGDVESELREIRGSRRTGWRDRRDRLSETERQRMLRSLDEIRARLPLRSHSDVEAELREIRESRRTGWLSREEAAAEPPDGADQTP